MKVQINNHNKPLPGAAGAAVGGIFNLIGGMMDAANQRDAASLQHKREKELMEIENQYAVDAFNRENAYNDPSAVRKRFEAAGINPAAAMGGSATGAGISGSMSVPSGSSSSAPSYNNFGGLGNAVMQGMAVDEQRKQTDNLNKLREAQATEAYEKAKSIEIANQEQTFMRDNGAWYDKLNKTKGEGKSALAVGNMNEYRSARYDYEHALDMNKKYQEGEKLVAEINKLESDITRNDYLNNLTEDERKQVQEYTAKLKADRERVELDNKFFKTFGFYPNADLETALVGLGAKGVGKFVDLFNELKDKRKKSKKPVTKEDITKAVNDFSKTNDEQKQKNIVEQILTGGTYYPMVW